MGLSTVSVFKNLNNENKNLKKLTKEQLKNLQEALLGILDDIDALCKKYHLTYFLGGGSALGAVRHQGIIPWDDDIDINMPRKDFIIFKEKMKEELNEKYWIHSPEETKDYGLAFGRVRKKGTIYKTREDNKNNECGIYVDIFIIENTYNFFLFRYFHGLCSYFFGFLLSCRNFYENRKLYLEMVKGNKKNSFIFKIKIGIGFLISFLSVDCLTHLWNNVNKMCKNNNSKYVTVPVGRNHFFKEMYLRKNFCEEIRVEFSGRKFPICKDYDGYLKKLYGNYMKIPDKNQQETHIFLELKL